MRDGLGVFFTGASPEPGMITGLSSEMGLSGLISAGRFTVSERSYGGGITRLWLGAGCAAGRAGGGTGDFAAGAAVVSAGLGLQD